MTSQLQFVRLLQGPQTLGRGPLFWGATGVALLAAVAYPLLADGYTVGNTVYFFTWTFMALGLCVVWGYGGTLRFGQTAVFGLSGYPHCVLTLDFGGGDGFTLVGV